MSNRVGTTIPAEGGANAAPLSPSADERSRAYAREAYRRDPRVKARVLASNRRLRERNPQRSADYTLKYLYGLELGGYDRLLESQGGRCAICGTEEPGKGITRFHVDHDHATKAVRGLLCFNCNRSLGVIESDDFVDAALAYLLRTSG